MELYSFSVYSPVLMSAHVNIQSYKTGLWDIHVDDRFGYPPITLANALTVLGSCGDLDGDGDVNAADIVRLVNFIFDGSMPPVDVSQGDFDCYPGSNVSDIVYLVNYIFGGGPAPCQGC